MENFVSRPTTWSTRYRISSDFPSRMLEPLGGYRALPYGGPDWHAQCGSDARLGRKASATFL